MSKEDQIKETTQEKKHLKETIEIMQQQIQQSEENIRRLYKEFDPKSEDPYVIEHLTGMYAKKSRDLARSLNAPYFARIDFREEGDQKEKEIYIGKCSVFRNNADLQVIDWRTPIASLYYDGRLGNVSYEAPTGEVKGDLSLKRVYDIEKGELKSFSDVDITTNDELLKPYLSASADNRLKNIISTIQTEQNKIIRAKLRKPIIVQGVAGSGKTTVALHRIAYLAYAHEKELKPQDFLIIAPNKFFLDYISAILPDLGVDDVSQLTFEDFAKEIIGKGIKIENSNSKLADIVNNGKSIDDIEQRTSKFKSSLEYKKILDEYSQVTQLGFLPDEDLKVGDIVILSKEKLREGFNEQFHREGTPMEDRFKTYVRRLGSFIENNQEMIEDLIRRKRQLEIEKIDQNLPEEQRKKKKFEIFDKYDPLLKLLDNGGKKLLANYSKKAGKKSALEIYKEFVSQLREQTDGIVPQDIVTQMQKKLLSNPRSKEVEYEDLAPLMYIQHKIKGTEIAKSAKHIVIDEAQDYSEFQFAAVKDILQNESMTILGDIAQGIYSYRGTNDWDKVNKDIFDGKAEILQLGKSYRTTMEIMEKGNDVIDKIRDRINVKLGEPVIRKGVPVNIAKHDEKELVGTITSRINELLQSDKKNIAVITKTLQEATELYKKLVKAKVPANLISDKATEYKGGISVIPSYLSKGLEFDSVILSDASKEEYGNNELDAKLLYIAITRAMHTLDIYYTRERSELLTERKRENRDNKNIIELEDEER